MTRTSPVESFPIEYFPKRGYTQSSVHTIESKAQHLLEFGAGAMDSESHR